MISCANRYQALPLLFYRGKGEPGNDARSCTLLLFDTIGTGMSVLRQKLILIQPPHLSRDFHVTHKPYIEIINSEPYNFTATLLPLP